MSVPQSSLHDRGELMKRTCNLVTTTRMEVIPNASPGIGILTDMACKPDSASLKALSDVLVVCGPEMLGVSVASVRTWAAEHASRCPHPVGSSFVSISVMILFV